NEGFIAVEYAMATGEQISFEPAFALMLAEHFHDSPLAGEEFITREQFRLPLSIGRFEDRRQAIGDGLVRAEDAEIALFLIELDHIAQEATQYGGVSSIDRAGLWHRDSI